MRRGRKHQRTTSSGVVRKSSRGSKPRTTAGKSKKKTNSKGVLKKTINVLSICLFIALIACLGIGAGMYAAISQEMGQMNMHDLSLVRSSIVYYTDDNGNSQEAATLFSDGNSIWIESSEIADVMKEAIVSIEDERFYDHNGVDIKRTGGAVIGFVKEKLGMGRASYGGSTITQQVIKNITQERDRTATRKIKEMMRAVAIEKQLSKDEILTMYLNIIYLANNCYGIEAASNMYFDKSAKDLELHEAALIAGITQKPSYYDPLDNPENAVTKRNTVLAKMYELGKISEEEYNAAIAMDIDLKGSHRQAKNKVYSYFVDNVINDVIRDLQIEKGYTETFAKQQVFSGGLKIYTTMDNKIQTAIEEVFENDSNFPSGAKKAQAAMIIIDPKTGEIKGLVGGKGEKVDSRGFNRATQMTRQPGSSIKPLSVYGPGIEEGFITPGTKVVDESITIKDWSPKNAYSGFKGAMTVKKAVEISSNIPAVKITKDMGVDVSFKYVKNKFHISTIEDSDKDLSPMALGGLTKGVTLEDMAAAYAVFANDGVYTKPYSYTKVLDSANRVLLENEPESERVISSATAFIMSDMLKGVVEGSSGTGRLARMSDMTVYGKTGTTNNDYDKWFVGYTDYYVGAVWFGFDQQKSIRSAGIYNNISAKLWKQVMTPVHEGLEKLQIKPTDDVVKAYVCSETGKLKNDNCTGMSQYFKKGTEPKKYCTEGHLEEIIPETIPGEQIPPAVDAPSEETEVGGTETTTEPTPQIPPIADPPTEQPPAEENDGVITIE